ncbi:MAG: hypothetical protein AABY09_04980 [Nanoarchaeota archaeon]
MRKPNKKRGQGTEMIGLLVIIILLIVLVVLYLNFATKPKTDITTSTRASVTSSNLLNAMMLYSVCPGKDFQDAVKDCASGDAQLCGKSSCEIVKREGLAIISNTLKGELKGERMFFSIEDSSAEPPKEILRVPEEKDLKCPRRNCEDQGVPLTKIKAKLCRCLS